MSWKWTTTWQTTLLLMLIPFKHHLKTQLFTQPIHNYQCCHVATSGVSSSAVIANCVPLCLTHTNYLLECHGHARTCSDRQPHVSPPLWVILCFACCSTMMSPNLLTSATMLSIQCSFGLPWGLMPWFPAKRAWYDLMWFQLFYVTKVPQSSVLNSGECLFPFSDLP